MPAPSVIAVGVAKGVVIGSPDVTTLANEALSLLPNCPPGSVVEEADVVVDGDWLGDDYSVPTPAADDAIRWAARRGGWVLDRVYSGKGLSGVLGRDAAGEWAAGDDVVLSIRGASRVCLLLREFLNSDECDLHLRCRRFLR